MRALAGFVSTRIVPRRRWDELQGAAANADVPVTVQTTPLPAESVPGWVTRLLITLVVYVVAAGIWMMTGAGGPEVQHYLGLLADGPANLAAVIVAVGGGATGAGRTAPERVAVHGGGAGAVLRRGR